MHKRDVDDFGIRVGDRVALVERDKRVPAWASEGAVLSGPAYSLEVEWSDGDRTIVRRVAPHRVRVIDPLVKAEQSVLIRWLRKNNSGLTFEPVTFDNEYELSENWVHVQGDWDAYYVPQQIINGHPAFILYENRTPVWFVIAAWGGYEAIPLNASERADMLWAAGFFLCASAPLPSDANCDFLDMDRGFHEPERDAVLELRNHVSRAATLIRTLIRET